MLRGLKFEPGSVEEAIASVALTRQNTVHYLTTMSVINAIIHVGNVVATAVAGGQSSAADSLKKSIEDLKEVLFPEDKVNKNLKAGRIKQILEREAGGGILRVQTMDKPKGKKLRRS